MNHSRSFLAVLALWAFVATVRPEHASASPTSTVLDQKLCTATAVPASGGTTTCDFLIPTDRAYRLTANVGLAHINAGHMNAAGSLFCEYVVENQNGALSAPAIVTGSLNPANENSTTYVAAHVQASDAAFTNAGGGTFPLCRWSISGTNARVTVTNNSSTSVTADVTILIQAFQFGSQ